MNNLRLGAPNEKNEQGHIPQAKGPKGFSCFEKQTAKHFLKLKKFKNLGIPGKLYVYYFPFYNN